MDITLFASLVGMSPYVNEREHQFRSLGLVFGSLALYVAIAHWKGEPNNWND
jgi:hypothetical protein